MSVKIKTLIGIALLCGWFLMNAYICLTQTKVFSEEINRSYIKLSDGYHSKEF